MIPAPVLQVLRGFLMGAADIVPGVSGGTVALILGIYRTLIETIRSGAHALRQLVTGDLKSGLQSLKAVNWMFLIPLGIGVVVAFVALRGFMKTNLEEHSAGTAAVFCGLVAASCWLVWRTISNRDPLRFGVVVGVAVLAFWLLGYQNGAIADPALPLFFLTGAIAICAMILPGISGSFIMLMLGMYGAVLDGSPVQLLVFLVGATAGLGGFSSLLNWLLKHHEQTVMAALLGLMLGSFRVLWPWPNGVGYTEELPGGAEHEVPGTGLELWPDASALVGALALAAVAGGITLAVVALAERLNAQDVNADASVSAL